MSTYLTQFATEVCLECLHLVRMHFDESTEDDPDMTHCDACHDINEGEYKDIYDCYHYLVRDGE